MRWQQVAAELSIPVDTKKVNDFIELFDKWNRRINLSGADNREAVAEHVEDSLHVVPVLRERPRVLDVGSGGGFPVVVAALCLPDVRFTSLEPVHKKHAFLRTVARELGLANLDARAERLDDHATHDYDAAVSRATFDLVEWLARGRGFVRAGGIVVGFEAVPRTDLPASAARHAYQLAGKPRAIIVDARPE